MKHDLYRQLLDELRVESDDLITQLSTLPPAQWRQPTPAPRWTIHDQVTHLAYFDDATIDALRRDRADFRRFADGLMADGMDFPDRIAEQHRDRQPQTVLSWFIDSRAELLDQLAALDPRARMPWFGPDMSAASAATARLMETWAHGRDIYDTLAVTPAPSPGLRSVAHLGVSTFAFTHTLHGLDVPTEPVFVELLAPSGELWRWGPADTPQWVHGSAEDFALVVTQRRHWTQTALTVEGAVARQWLDIAQAFAGAPTRRAVPQ
jgi:uncharacterized protein (TIGR03084 family)